MPTMTGGCLCGAVRYECSVDSPVAGICHCTHCQKTSGSAFSVNVFVQSETVKMTGGIGEYADTAESGRKVVRKFCKTCGSSLASEAEAFPGMLIIKAGTLDDRSGLRPGVQVWTQSKQPWVDLGAALKSFDKGRT